jgi:hypothetical protein
MDPVQKKPDPLELPFFIGRRKVDILHDVKPTDSMVYQDKTLLMRRKVEPTTDIRTTDTQNPVAEAIIG